MFQTPFPFKAHFQRILASRVEARLSGSRLSPMPPKPSRHDLFVFIVAAALFTACGRSPGTDTGLNTTSDTIGGTLTGLAPDASVTLQNNGSDDLVLVADGVFAFETALKEGSAYDVTVLTQPSSQTCGVTGGTGILDDTAVGDVAVHCVTETIDTYTVGGTLTGLAPGATVTLQNNEGDDLILNADGIFQFATALLDVSAYDVAVLTQPTSPSQTCAVTNGAGSLAGADVADVAVDCVTNSYAVSGTLTGLAPGATVTLQNNEGDDLLLSVDGIFQFATALLDGSAYDVAVLTQPTSPSQSCAVTNGVGSVGGADIADVAVDCITQLHTIGGTLTGLVADRVVLQNNGSDDLLLVGDGDFEFATALPDGSAFEVTVLAQPDVPDLVCFVSAGSGILNAADVNIDVQCWNIRAHLVGEFAFAMPEEQNTRALAVGDLDGDLDLDLVVGNDNEPDQIYFNDGLGGYTDSGQLLGNEYTRSVALGDLDGDGDLDLVAGHWNFQHNRVYLNDGDGGFADTGQLLGGATNFTASVALGDVDGDGDLDLVAGTALADTVLLNDGLGNFTDSGQALGSDVTYGIALGDVDGDLDLDLVAAREGAANRVYLNDGAGVYVDSGQLLGSSDSVSVALGDLDGDLDLDLVVGNGNGDANVVYVNDGAGTYTDSGQWLGMDNTGIALGDIDEDGDLDALMASLLDPVQIYVNDGAGNLLDSGQVPLNRSTYALVLADVDGDLDLDVLEGNSLRANRALLNTGFGDYVAGATNLDSSEVTSVVLGDVDGDFDLDLVVWTVQGFVYFNDGTGTYVDSGQLMSHFAKGISLGDVDGDLDLDLVLAAGTSRVLFNDGTGVFTDSGQLLPNGVTSYDVAMGDIDGDLDLDLVFGNFPGNQVYVNDGTGQFSDSGQALGNGDTAAVALADVDGDLDLDLVAGNQSSQANRVYLNDGGGNFVDSGQSLHADHTRCVVIGDVDGDLDLDLIAGNSGVNRIYLNDGAGVYADSGQVLGVGSAVTLGDVDGDLDPDLVIGNSGQDDRIYLNDGSGNFNDSGQLLGTVFTGVVALGDIDGDLDLDLMAGHSLGTQIRLNLTH